ncbi:hypothetical protein E2C01_066121 [Portunus trituberculatus]|uniref:Uncharacterized protein n=1 Tax=Portunus trituberculatus TaxID=210409 RepID=A0A5B7HGA3_PORTR|nr:hypothetical protein [Portunus trituberculatus]
MIIDKSVKKNTFRPDPGTFSGRRELVCRAADIRPLCNAAALRFSWLQILLHDFQRDAAPSCRLKWAVAERELILRKPHHFLNTFIANFSIVLVIRLK